MSVILSKSLSNGSQSLELVVKYDTNSHIAELKSIWLISHGKQIPVGNLLKKFFELAIKEIIEQTDWKEVYKEMGEEKGEVHPTIMQSLSPFVK